MDEPHQYSVPVASDEEVAAFIARHGKLHDPETDDYIQEPFVADIREGKNDPDIRYAHLSYEGASAGNHPIHPPLHGAWRHHPGSVLR